MKRNIYTTSAKDYYDNAPMMDMYSFLASEGYDINNNPQITKEVLDKLYKNKTILWATDIQHSMGVYRNGAVIDMHLAHNEICACRVVKIKKEYYLKDIGVMPIKDIGVKDNEEYEELFNTFPEYSFECAMCTVKFTKVGEYFVLPEDIHASKSYECVNRLRYNISQGNYAKAGMAMSY